MTQPEAQVLEHAGAMPAATWHFLNMNDCAVQVPAGLAAAPHVQVDAPEGALGGPDALERALEAVQREWEAGHPAPTPEELAEREAFLAAEADATYGGTAQSAYQAAAGVRELSRSLAETAEHGMGAQVAGFLRQAGEHVVVEAAAGADVRAQVRVQAVPGAASVAWVDVVAHAGSRVTLSLLVDAEDAGAGADGAAGGDAADGAAGGDAAGDADAVDGAAGAADGAGAPEPLGLAGTTVRVLAAADAHVGIVRTQALDERFADIDDACLLLHDRARVDVRQVVLGAARSYTGLACDLRGTASQADLDVRYLGTGARELDFNYLLRQYGAKSRCDLQANGVLAGASRKCFRGTIDLVRGAAGAQGSEQETVLLADEAVRNKTVPVILCDEDDVAGNHGATIGHVRQEQMFYMACRGLSPDEAERLFVEAQLEHAAIAAPDRASRDAVARLADRLVPGMAARLDDDEEVVAR